MVARAENQCHPKTTSASSFGKKNPVVSCPVWGLLRGPTKEDQCLYNKMSALLLRFLKAECPTLNRIYMSCPKLPRDVFWPCLHLADHLFSDFDPAYVKYTRKSKVDWIPTYTVMLKTCNIPPATHTPVLLSVFSSTASQKTTAL